LVVDIAAILPQKVVIMKMMLDSGADWTLKDNAGETVRDIAQKNKSKARKIYSKILKLLDTSERVYTLYLGRRFHHDDHTHIESSSLTNFFCTLPRTISLIFSMSPKYEKRKAVVAHVTNGGLVHDLFIELMSMM
jgi:hypothetical protein